jgi:hypothetical protein
MQIERLIATARHLLLDDAPIGEPNRVWLRRGSDAGDWIEGDEVRIDEMSPASLRSGRA